MDKEVLVSLITSLPGLLSLVILYRNSKVQRKKEESEAVGEITETVLSLLEPLKDQIKSQKERIEEQEELISILRIRIKDLETQLDALRGK